MTATPRPRDTFVARIPADQTTARRIASTVAELLDPETSAVSIFETVDGWTAEVVFQNDADRALIADSVNGITGADAKALVFSTIEMRDWVAASLEGLAPVRAGRFVIHGAHDRNHIRANEIGIAIEAALAFGTGHHGTTRGCLLAFEAIRKQMTTQRAWRILDIGTGTGVLAIAAARALHVRVLASDIDPTAVTTARENARRNHAASLVHVFTAGGAQTNRLKGDGRYDLIFANILDAPLRRMSKAVSDLLAPGGRIILSGLLPVQANGVIAAYRRQGLALESRLTLDGWATLIMRN